MEKAIQDSRTVTIARSAQALAAFKKIDTDSGLSNPSDGFANPGSGASQADPDSPSYPVFIDPTGWLTATGLDPAPWHWVGAIGDGTASNVPRRSASFAPTTQLARRWFTMLDDIYFGQAGLADDYGTPGSVRREPTYSYAFLCQRPKTNNQSIVSLSI